MTQKAPQVSRTVQISLVKLAKATVVGHHKLRSTKILKAISYFNFNYFNFHGLQARVQYLDQKGKKQTKTQRY